MYIPEFWCGVGATIAVEIVGLIGIAIWQEKKVKEQQNEKK